MSRRSLLLLITIVAVFLIAGVIAFKNLAVFAPPSINSSSIETARVDYGTVLTTVEAEGVVEPESEVLLLSPASTKIEKIFKAPGSRVSSFQSILKLDSKPLEEEIAKLEDQIGIKRNNLQRNKLNARSTRLDLDYQVEMKKLRIASLKSDITDQEKLLEVGGISPAKFDQTKQELTTAEKDLEMIQSKNSIRLQQLIVEERGLELQIDIQEKELEAMKEILSKTSVRAPSSGIILSINGREGEMVSKDKLLVRISDLSSFKISASIDEGLADQVKTGKTVFARIDHENLLGQIGMVYPELEGNKLKFDVYLEESNHPKLLSNMNLQLLVVRRLKEDVMRLEMGEESGRGKNIELYIKEQDKLVKRSVGVGLRGKNFIEITSGLEAGDEVVISQTTEFRNRPEIVISN